MADLEQTLRDIKPAWQTDGLGLQGPRRHVTAIPPTDVQRTDFAGGAIIRQSPLPKFPEVPAVEEQATTATTVPSISFISSDASVVVHGIKTYKVLVADGKIKGTFPSGMGAGNYILTLGDPADSYIYAGATFNPTSLAITSRFLGVSSAAAFPESRVESAVSGFLYWQLAFTYLTARGVFKIINTRVGDINFELVYGAMNGQPALLPVNTDPGWLDLALL